MVCYGIIRRCIIGFHSLQVDKTKSQNLHVKSIRHGDDRQTLLMTTCFVSFVRKNSKNYELYNFLKIACSVRDKQKMSTSASARRTYAICAV